MLMRHRLPLEGAFDVRVSISEWQLFDCVIGLGVTRERYETSAPGNKSPPSTSGAINANGCDIVAGFEGVADVNRVIFNNYTLSNVTAQGLRLRRYLDGSTWMLEGFYHDGTNWVSHANWVDEFDGQTLYAYLHLIGKYGHVRWTDFVETEGAQFRVSSVSGTESVNQAAWPCYESQIYDARQSVDWSKLSWTETLPTNTDVRLQLAVSEDPEGPWTYAGPSGANTYYSTAAGHTLTDVTGQYCRFRAFLYSTDGADTPELSNVHLSHSGTSASRMNEFTYDDAGNLLEIAITDDSGTTTETRTVNDLNQIDTATGGWEFLYDDNGCLIEKNNGTGVGDEKWEFSWNEDDRLIQVKKGVYAAGPVLVNEFTVDYTYDSMGRMMTRDDGIDVTTFVWDGWDLLSETTDSITTDYLVPNGLVHSFLRDGDLYVVHHDALGSVRMVTDDAGDVVAQFEYGAWGELLDGSVDSVPGGMPFGFVGGLGVRTDAVTGLLYMRNRHYDPQLQRFISRDAVHTSNRYIYAGNNPLAFVDYNGLAPTPADSAYENLRLDTARTRRTQERLLRILKQFRLQKLSKCFQSLWKKTVVVYGTPYDSDDQGWTTATSSTSGKILLDQGLNDTDTMPNLYHETLHLAGNIGSGCECTPDGIKTVWDVSEITSVIVTSRFEPTRIEHKPFDYPEQITRFRRQHVLIYLSQAQLWKSLGSKESTNSKAFGDILSKLNAPGLNHDINQTSTIDRVMPRVEKYFQIGPHDFGL